MKVPLTAGRCGRYIRVKGKFVKDANGKKVSCGGTLKKINDPTDYRDTVYRCDKCGEETLPYFLADIFSIPARRA